jgi:hypothetical protein
MTVTLVRVFIRSLIAGTFHNRHVGS